MGLRLTCPGKALGGSRFNSRHGTARWGDCPDLFFDCDLSWELYGAVKDADRPLPVVVVHGVHDESRQLELHIRSRGGRLTGRCHRFLWGLARGIDHLDSSNLHLELSRFLVGEHEPSGIQGAASQTVLGNIALTISPIGSIVKSARIVQLSNVVLTIYYVTISDERHAEPSPCFKVLHSRLYLV